MWFISSEREIFSCQKLNNCIQELCCCLRMIKISLCEYKKLGCLCCSKIFLKVVVWISKIGSSQEKRDGWKLFTVAEMTCYLSLNVIRIHISWKWYPADGCFYYTEHLEGFCTIENKTFTYIYIYLQKVFGHNTILHLMMCQR